MAKKSMIARENKRNKLVQKYVQKRAALKEVIRDPNTSFEDKERVVLEEKVE